MTRRLCFVAFLLFQAAVCAGAGVSGYEVTDRIDFPGTTHWDRVHFDADGHRLYIAQPPAITVLDTDKKTVVGTIFDAGNSHDIAIDHDQGRGFYSTGQQGEIAAFDLDTLKKTGSVKSDGDFQGLIYDPLAKRLIGINTRLRAFDVYDPKRLKLIGKIDLEGPPKGMVVQKNGNVFVNIQYDDALLGIDPRKVRQVSRGEFKECKMATGLAVDPQWRMYTVCRNGKLVVWTPEGKLLKEFTIADPRWSYGIDGVVWQDGHLFVANGNNATLLVVDETKPNEFEVVETIPTARGARTLAADPEHHRLYTISADLDTSKGWWGSPKPLEGSMHVTVIERRE